MQVEIFIVTDPEAGWDCILGAYTSIESLVKTLELPSELKTLKEVDDYFNKRNNYMRVIHKVKLQ